LSLEVDISGAQNAFKQAGVNVHTAVPKLLNRMTGQGERKMKQLTPVKTGNLRNSVTSVVQDFEAAIWNSANYAQYVNWDTKPHIIRAKRAKFLHFTIAGNDIFVKQVHHPGTKGKQFLEKTYAYLVGILPAETERIIKGALK